MYRVFIIAMAMLVVSETHALEMQVKKVKGRKAIVELSESYAVSVGDHLTVTPGGESKKQREVASYAGQPQYAFTGGMDIEGISYESDGADFDVSRTIIDVRFGWVKPQFEAGPILQIDNQTFDFGVGNVEINSIFIGGYGEYNLAPATEKFIPAIGGIIGYTSNELASDVSGFRIQPYVRGKFFLSGGAGVALLGQIGYRYDKLSGNGVDVTGSGLVLNAGIGYYY